jgi:putative holliday junction resolvase
MRSPKYVEQSRPLRKGKRLGVDVGTVRVGIASSDPDGLLAFPLVTLPFSERIASDIAEIVTEHEAIEVIVGLPMHLSGSEGVSAQAARRLAHDLVLLGVQARLIDERLTTTSASSSLRQSGKSTREQKSLIDQEAARVILQLALDSERASGRPPGSAP